MNQDQKDKLAKFAEATESSVNALIRTVTLMGETVEDLGERMDHSEAKFARITDLGDRLAHVEAKHVKASKVYLGELELAKDVQMNQAFAEMVARLAEMESKVTELTAILKGHLEIHTHRTTDAPEDQLKGVDEATKREFLRLLSDHVRKTQ